MVTLARSANGLVTEKQEREKCFGKITDPC